MSQGQTTPGALTYDGLGRRVSRTVGGATDKPALKLVIPAGTTITDEDGEPVEEISITPIPLDRPPYRLFTNAWMVVQAANPNQKYHFDYTLDAPGKVTRTDITDPNENVTRVDYDADGYSTSETYALGTPKERTYTYERASGTHFLNAVTDSFHARRTEYTYWATAAAAGAAQLRVGVRADAVHPGRELGVEEFLVGVGRVRPEAGRGDDAREALPSTTWRRTRAKEVSYSRSSAERQRSLNAGSGPARRARREGLVRDSPCPECAGWFASCPGWTRLHESLKTSSRRASSFLCLPAPLYRWGWFRAGRCAVGRD